jgi:nitric oxide reductase NorD protein
VDHLELEPWEPEETVGKLWHAFASRLDAPADHAEAAVTFAEIEGRLGLLFRGLGGAPSIDLRPAAREVQRHRLSWRRRLATDAEREAHASFDGEAVRLPERIARFPDRETNAALYVWLAAAAAHSALPPGDDDPLRADLAALRAAVRMTEATLADAPGLRPLHALLAGACLAERGVRELPRTEAAIEALIRHLLGSAAPTRGLAAELVGFVHGRDADLAGVAAPRGYHRFRAVPLWFELRPPGASAASAHDDAADGAAATTELHRTVRARRKPADEAERKDSLVMHRFEAILSLADFLNLNRRAEDDDTEAAKKALDDQDEVALGQISKRAATRLKVHLDLAPEDVDRERLSGTFTYPEWDQRAGTYLADHCRVLASTAEPAREPPAFTTDPRARRRLKAVKRQFESLRPKRLILPRQLDGDELDLEAAVASRVDLRTTGEGSDRVYRNTRPQERDLAVSILLDVSRSTESGVGDHRVIDVEKEALAAMAWGLDACGDDCAIHAFSSLRRDRVYVLACKAFGETMGGAVEARLGGLEPGFYTRLGAAVRHVSKGLQAQPRQRRLLLVITDGKPNDLDHYEGRHGLEDSRKAIAEARRLGQSVHGVVVEAQAKPWFARLFGRGGYSVITEPDHLTVALPEIYRRLVGA